MPKIDREKISLSKFPVWDDTNKIHINGSKNTIIYIVYNLDIREDIE